MRHRCHYHGHFSFHWQTGDSLRGKGICVAWMHCREDLPGMKDICRDILARLLELINSLSILLHCFPPYSGLLYLFPKQCGKSRVLMVRVKAGCLIGSAHRASGLIRCYLQYIHSPRDLRSACRLRRLAESGGLARVLFETALSLWCRARFLTW